MLVLSRKPDEKIVITVPPSEQPQTIEMRICSVRNDKVRIGFDADRDVTIHRQEVADAIARETAADNNPRQF